MKVKDISYEHQQTLMSMLSQLLIVLVNRLGGEIDVPIEEIDGTFKYEMSMRMSNDAHVFHFEAKEKGNETPR